MRIVVFESLKAEGLIALGVKVEKSGAVFRSTLSVKPQPQASMTAILSSVCGIPVKISRGLQKLMMVWLKSVMVGRQSAQPKTSPKAKMTSFTVCSF